MVGRKRKSKPDGESEQKTQETQEKAEKVEFSWSDDEIQLLLMSALDFKAQCEFEGVDWESKRSKYEQIFEIVTKEYPDGEHYQNKKSMTKDRVTAKLKSIRTGFKKAADAGRRSGGGRVVFTFYDLCMNLWGGSPSVTSISSGLDTSQRDEDTYSEPASPTYPRQQENLPNNDCEIINDHEKSTETDTTSTSNNNEKSGKKKKQDLEEMNQKALERRKSVTDMLKNRKDKKMSHNLSTDKQLIQISQEDVTLKRELLDKMEKSDQEFKASFTELNKTMATIGTAIQQSVGLLGQLLNQGIPPAMERPSYRNGSYAQQLGSFEDVDNQKENYNYENL